MKEHYQPDDEERTEREMLKLNMFGLVCLHLHKLRMKISEAAVNHDIPKWLDFLYECYRNAAPLLKETESLSSIEADLDKVWDDFYTTYDDPEQETKKKMRAMSSLSKLQIRLYKEMDKAGLYAPKIKYRFGVAALKDNFGLTEEELG